MTKKWFIILLILITVVNLSALGTFIYNRCCPSPETNCMMNEIGDHCCYMQQHLNMTDEQTSKIGAVEKSSRPITETLAIQMKDRRIELVKELMETKTDSIKIELILQEIDSLQATMQRQIVHRLISEKGILTPQQQEKFYSLVLGQFCTEIDSIKQTQCQNNKSQ